MSWTKEKEELLAKLWKQGLSASQIALRINARLGGRHTRNAVIGKRIRLGLPDRARGTTEAANHRNRAVRRAKARPRTSAQMKFVGGNEKVRALFQSDGYVPPSDEVVIPVGERKTIQTLGADDCRWPIGDPQMADFHFCGKDKVPGIPYCEIHARRAFVAPQARQSRAAPAKKERADA